MIPNKIIIELTASQLLKLKPYHNIVVKVFKKWTNLEPDTRLAILGDVNTSRKNITCHLLSSGVAHTIREIAKLSKHANS
jgi:hypothetical protein